MKRGDFVFLKNEYFQKFANQYLMENKLDQDNQQHKRPYVITKIDKQNPDIYWAVPISSQVQKFQEKYNSTIEKYHKCSTIRFGYVNHEKRAFLLQNMCPITEKYIENIYKNRYGEAIHIDKKLLENLRYNTNKILDMSKRHIKITYGDIFSMRKALKQELFEEQSEKIKKDISNDSTNPIQAFCERWAQKTQRNHFSLEEKDNDLDLE